VAITPTRILDTRTDVGLAGPFVSGKSQTLQVTGTVPTQPPGGVAAVATEVVPVVASSVVFNVTVIKPVTKGFLSIRPGDASGTPATSNINWAAGGANIANAVTVQLPTSGDINIFVNGTVGHVLIDVAGYNVPGGTGADGVQGVPGNNGANGADGVPVRRYGRTITSLSTVDNTGIVGFDSSIAVGADANLIISYYDSTNSALKVAACTNPTCTDATVSTVDNTDNVGRYTSITIGADANPIISYYDSTNSALKVAACTNPTCTDATLSTVDNTATLGSYTSITIGADANPIISYWNETNDDLKVAACTNPTCDQNISAATVSIVDNTDSVGAHTSITIGADANPIISYWNVTNDDLKVAACTNPTCDQNISAATVSTVDNTDSVGAYTSITIGADANPIISYHDETNGHLKVAACTNPTCDHTISAATLSTVDNTGVVGLHTSITIGADANPIISHYDETNGHLKVAACTNPTCDHTISAATLSTVDNTGDVGGYTSITIGADANPIISYYDFTNSALKVAKLTPTSWTPNTWES
jgi:hypothetical protein